MKKWEYALTILEDVFDKGDLDRLNKCGQQGWEVVAVKDDRFLVKREIPEPVTQARNPEAKRADDICMGLGQLSTAKPNRIEQGNHDGEAA